MVLSNITISGLFSWTVRSVVTGLSSYRVLLSMRFINQIIVVVVVSKLLG